MSLKLFFQPLLLALFFLFAGGRTTLAAQDTLSLDARRAAAAQAAGALRTGGLVVRLPSNRKKIEEMERLLTAEPNERERLRLQRELEHVRADTREQNLLWMSAFRQHYTATPVLFMYDADTDALLAGHTSGFLLKDNLTADPQLTLPADYLLTRINYTDPSTSARTEAFIFSDARLNDLQRPALTAVKIANTGFLLNRLLAPDIAAAKRAEKTVRRLQDKVTEFLESYARN